MNTTRFPALLAALALGSVVATTQAPAPAPLAPPVFHHLHLNSTDPAAAIAGYLKLWPNSTEKATLAGFDGVKNGKVYLLFNKVNTPAPREPQSAYWHQVWLTPNVREYVARARANKMEPEPLYTSDEGDHVDISSDTFAGSLTKAALAEAKAKGVMPTHQAGFTFTHGPEGLSVEGFERAGETGRLAQIDMWQDDPVCAELWYQAASGQHPPRASGRNGAADRGHLQSRAGRAELAVDHEARHQADAERAWRVRRRGAVLVHAARRSSARQHPRPGRRSPGLGGARSGRVGGEAETGERHVSAGAVRVR